MKSRLPEDHAGEADAVASAAWVELERVGSETGRLNARADAQLSQMTGLAAAYQLSIFGE